MFVINVTKISILSSGLLSDPADIRYQIKTYVVILLCTTRRIKKSKKKKSTSQ